MSASIFFLGKIKEVRQKYEVQHRAAMLEMQRHRKGTAAYLLAKRRAEILHKKLYPKGAYFQDNYDGTSLMRRLGLSWHDQRILQNIGSNGCMHVSSVESLIIGIRRSKIQKLTKQEIRNLRLQTSGRINVHEWDEFFRLKKDQLLRLLKYAVKANEPVKFSV